MPQIFRQDFRSSEVPNILHLESSEDGDTDRWLLEQFVKEVSPTFNGIEIDAVTQKYGTNSWKVVVRDGDEGIPGAGERAQLSGALQVDGGGADDRVVYQKGLTNFIHMSVRPSSWVSRATQWGIIWEVKQLWNNPVISLQTPITDTFTGWFLQTNGGIGDTGQNLINHDLSTPFDNDVFTDFLIKVYMHETDGTVDVWTRRDGATGYTKVLSKTGLATYQFGGATPGTSASSHILGLYRADMAITDTINIDGFRIGESIPAALGQSKLVEYADNSTPRTYYASDGTLTSAANDTPRQTHRYDGANWVPKGYLVEGARTNDCLQSETLDNAGWVKSGSTVSANSIAAPDGNTTADKIVEDSSNGVHRVHYPGLSPAATARMCASGFFKAAERTEVRLLCGKTVDFNNSVLAYYDLSAGTVGTISTVNGSNEDAGIVDVGGGWYFCWVSAIPPSLSAGQSWVQVSLSDGNEDVTYQGDGSSGLYAWGLQLEGATSFPSSYVPTTTGTVARNADDGSTYVFGTSPATLVIDARTPLGYDAADQVLLDWHDGSTNNNVVAARQSGVLHVIFRAGGIEVADLNLGALADDTGFRLTFSCADNKFGASLDGATAVHPDPETGTAPVNLSFLELGKDQADSNHWFSSIEQVWAYDERYEDAQLQDPFGNVAVDPAPVAAVATTPVITPFLR